MAEFLKSFRCTDAHEGGWANNPDDPGGETYRGISRVAHPSWSGWEIIDKYRGKPGFPGNLKDSQSLGLVVSKFYEMRFWQPIWGDAIQQQALADAIFDFAVNSGVEIAVKKLQICLNVWNNQQKLYPDVKEDGIFGKKTLESIYAFLEKRKKPHFLINSYYSERMVHFHKIARNSESQEQFMVSWASRMRFDGRFGNFA